MDGTLLQAWASHASLEPIDSEDNPPSPPSGSGEVFEAPKAGKKRAKGYLRGVKLSNVTCRSRTDPLDAAFSEGVALLARKSMAHPALLSYQFSERTSRRDSHVFIANRHDLVVNCRFTQDDGFGE